MARHREAPHRRVDRVLLVVLDGLGIGAVAGRNPPPTSRANSLRNAVAAAGGADVPFLAAAGLFAAAGEPGRHQVDGAWAWGRTRQRSRFPESYAAHWEMAGHLPTTGHGHPHGLDPQMRDRVERAVGGPVLGNLGGYPHLDRVPPELLREHLRTGRPILLAQGEEEPVSVLALYGCAAVLPPGELFATVRRAAPLLAGAAVPGRLCARVFDVVDGRPRVRTERLDVPYFTPPSTGLLDAVARSGRTTAAVGKVGGLFAGHGFTRTHDEWGSERILANTVSAWRATRAGLVWTNLNDLSRPTGAGRNSLGWVRALERYDAMLRTLHGELTGRDVLVVTGDHGVDPTLTGEHTYEWTPLLVAGRGRADGRRLGSREHADIGATIAELFDLPAPPRGRGFAALLGAGGEATRCPT